jgi:hypothetical protein
MASTKEMQARAKARKQTTQNCLAQSPNGDIKVYKVGSLDKFKELTGRLPYEFENMEYIGLQLADQVMSNNYLIDFQENIYEENEQLKIIEYIRIK